ncbi:MAG: hypothetical protein K2Y22_16680 [Candidatus Obscuribacterales bacterium]|nr:hypothetical protein [Candidatus Obscuribacterales bacterium]
MASTRKLASIALLLTLAVSIAPDASARFLHGYLKKDRAAASTTDGAQQLQPSSFPSTYEGLWRCQSTVIDSQINIVPPGHKLTSVIRFVKNTNGRLIAQWVQPGWNETQTSVQKFNESEAKLDRTNVYSGDGNSSWAARSQDVFTQIDDATMVAQSEVDQYMDGVYIGRYRTESILSRITQPEDLSSTGKAMANN